MKFMKKWSIFIFLAGSAFAAIYAGTQYNWGTSGGGAWQTPDDTQTKSGQALQIGTSGTIVTNTTTLPLGLPVASSTTINGLTPNTTGQIIYCNTCVTNNALCVSTGTSNSGQWVLLPSSGTKFICQ